MSKQSKHSEESKRERRKIVTAIILVVLIVLLAILLYFLLGDEDSRRVIQNEDDIKEVVEKQDYAPPGYYEATMNSTWNFASGNVASSNAYVENAKTNQNPVEFEVVRTDTNERVYKSPILEIGSHLDNVTLDTDLPKGTYDCVLTYYLLDKNYERIDGNTVDFSLTINVEQ